jgi:hypothetical protein
MVLIALTVQAFVSKGKRLSLIYLTIKQRSNTPTLEKIIKEH